MKLVKTGIYCPASDTLMDSNTDNKAAAKTANDVARSVLQKEAAAVAQMANELPSDFEAVVECLIGINGRVVVSGVGKSGHIGRKIAATMASTGTPSYFVHGA